MKTTEDSVSSGSCRADLEKDLSFVREHTEDILKSGCGIVYFERLKLDNGKTAVVKHCLSPDDLASVASDENVTSIVIE